MAKTVSIRVLLALAVATGWLLHQLDINNAYLHGDVDEEVYMCLLPGFHSKRGGGRVSSTSSSTPMVRRLVKSLYGLRQTSRQWYTKLSTAIQQFGLVQSHSDHSLFVYSKAHLFITLLVYVDDMIIIGNDSTCVVALKFVLD